MTDDPSGPMQIRPPAGAADQQPDRRRHPGAAGGDGRGGAVRQRPQRSLRLWLGALAVCVALGAAAPGRAATDPPDPDAGMGLICFWHVLITLRELGGICRPDDAAFQALLDEQISRLDRFIIDNAPVSQDELEVERRRVREAAMRYYRARGPEARETLCSGQDRSPPDFPSNPMFFYDAFRSRAAEMSGEFDRLLAVPRRPGLNPCF